MLLEGLESLIVQRGKEGRAGQGRVSGLSAGKWFCSKPSTPTFWNTVSFAFFLAKELFVSFWSLWFQIWFRSLSIIFPFVIRSFLPETGSVFAFGENKMGQLGLGNQTDAVPSPAQVPRSLLGLDSLLFLSVCAPFPRLRLYVSLDPL